MAMEWLWNGFGTILDSFWGHYGSITTTAYEWFQNSFEKVLKWF